MLVILSAAFVLPIAILTAGADGKVHSAIFRAEIRRGQTAQFQTEWGLLVVLRPVDAGWQIEVYPKDDPSANLALATPPFRGPNPTMILGWHFRNSNSSGPNAGEVNAPQHLREFIFVKDSADFVVLRHSLERVLWRGNYPGDEVRDAEEALARVSARAGRGRLRIQEMRLGNLEPGGRAWIEWLRFEVEICSSEQGCPAEYSWTVTREVTQY